MVILFFIFVPRFPLFKLFVLNSLRGKLMLLEKKTTKKQTKTFPEHKRNAPKNFCISRVKLPLPPWLTFRGFVWSCSNPGGYDLWICAEQETKWKKNKITIQSHDITGNVCKYEIVICLFWFLFSKSLFSKRNKQLFLADKNNSWHIWRIDVYSNEIHLLHYSQFNLINIFF